MNKNGSDFGMCLKSSNRQPKLDRYKHGLVCKKHMVTTNQKCTGRGGKCTGDMQVIKGKESKHDTRESHRHTEKGERE